MARGPHRCVLRDHVGDSLTFKAEAHLIPALVGNRWFFTTEECDTCNAAFGKECEEHLGHLLFAERVLLQMRGRGRPPRHKTPVGSTVGGVAPDGVIPIVLEEGETSVRFTWHDEHTFEFEMPQPAYSALGVYRSLARLAWLSLTPELRNLYPQVLGAAQGVGIAQTAAYWRAWYPGGGFRFVRLRVWRRVTDATLPEVLCELAACSSVLTWCAPSLDGGQQLPALLPPLSLSPSPPHEPQITKTNARASFPRTTATFTLGVESRVEVEGEVEPEILLREIASARGARPPAFTAPPRGVRLESEHAGNTYVIERCWLQVIPRDGSHALLFSGGTLAGTLLYEDTGAPSQVITPTLNVWSAPLADAQSTARFASALLSSGHLRILDLGTGSCVVEYRGGSVEASEDLATLVELLDAYSLIAARLGDDVRPPNRSRPLRTDVDCVLALAQLLRTGAVTISPTGDSVAIHLDADTADALSARLAAGESEATFRMILQMSIAGSVVTAGDCSLRVQQLAGLEPLALPEASSVDRAVRRPHKLACGSIDIHLADSS